jgi:hypothetical protein
MAAATDTMARLYLILGLAALSFFSWAQYRGAGLFDDTAASQAQRLAPGTRGTTFHK